jgi:hypothetical protein
MSRMLSGSLLVAAVSVATIGWEVRSFVNQDLGGIPEVAPMPVVPLTASAIDSVVDLNVLLLVALERPLFSENRRPAKTDGDLALRNGSAMRLAGVLTGPFGNRAIFIPVDQGKPVVVREGAHISDVFVRLIEPGRVVVELRDNVRTLTPSFDAIDSPAVMRALRRRLWNGAG